MSDEKQELCPECGNPIKKHSELGCCQKVDSKDFLSYCDCDLHPEHCEKLNLLNEMHLVLKCASTVNANGPAPRRANGGKAWALTSPFQEKINDMLSRAEKLLGKLE